MLAAVPAIPVPPTLVIALDTSSAMNDLPCAGCDTMSRWVSAVDAINATTAVTQQDVRWGLELIGDATNACGTVDAVDVLAALETASSIATALAARTDAGGGLTRPGNRPTRGAVLVATRQLMLQPDPEPRFIVVLTAGTPNCAAGATDAVTDDTAATVEAIRNAFLAGYGTFIVGLGEFDAATNESLQQMASAGNPNVTGPVPNLYTAFSSADVQAVLRSLVLHTSGCMFEVPPPPNELARRYSFSVYWDDLEVLRDNTQTNGWNFTDGSMRAIQFYGPACDLLHTDRAQLPVIRFNCPLIEAIPRAGHGRVIWSTWSRVRRLHRWAPSHVTQRRTDADHARRPNTRLGSSPAAVEAIEAGRVVRGFPGPGGSLPRRSPTSHARRRSRRFASPPRRPCA